MSDIKIVWILLVLSEKSVLWNLSNLELEFYIQ